MQTGTKISGFLHLGAIGLALFGGSLFRASPPAVLQVSNVSVITSEAFAAMLSSAPESVPDVVTAPVLKRPKSEDKPQDALPEVERSTEPLENQQTPKEQIAVIAPAPSPAPRIDTKSAPKPKPSAKEAETTQNETAPDQSASEAALPKQEQAPKEAATQIVTEADNVSDFAPTTSTIPRSRSRDLSKPAVETETAVTEPEPKPKPKAQTNDEIASAIAEAQADTSKPVGPALTGSEREGLVLAVQKCWNVPIGLQNADNLTVVISIELSQDGKLIKSPKLIEPAGTPTGTLRQAFEAGRRALIRCAPYDLPRDKYEQWREIEVVFNPENMVVK